jgi:hypothetical protein
LNVHCELHSGKRVSVRPAPAPPTQLNSSHARTRHRLKPLLALNRYSSAHLFHLLSTWPSTQYLTPSRSNNLIMSLTIVPRRVALRSATRSTPWARQFSTVVDDTFSPVAPASAPPPPPPQARKGRVLEEAVNATAPRFDWTKDEIREIYNTPLMELAFQAV